MRGTEVNRATGVKGLVAVGAASIAAALLFVAADPTATNYEITVYDSYSQFFWVLLFVAIVAGQVAIFESGRGEARRPYWKWGLAVVVAAGATMLLVPALRYHLFARGDMLTFIGMIRRIQALDLVPRSNYYPNIHLLAVTFSYVTGIDPSKTINIFPLLGSVFYLLSMYPLLTVIFGDFRKVLFVLPFTSLLLLGSGHWFFHPSMFAFSLLPFVFYLLFRGYGGRSTARFGLALVVAVVAVAFYHPAVTLFFTMMLVMLKLALLVGRRVSTSVPRNETTSVVAASIAFVLFFSWYYSFDSIIGSTLLILYTLVGASEGSTTFGNLTGVLARTSPELTDIVRTGIYTYGFIGAIVSMSLVFIAYYAYLVLRGRRRFRPLDAFLAGTVLVFTFGGTVAFFVDVTLSFHRIIRYARFAGGILIGSGFYTLFRRADPGTVDRYLRPLLYVAFFVFAFLATFMLYGSPLSNDRNLQITEAEVEGMQWVFDHRDPSLLIDELGTSQYRLYSFDPEAAGPRTNIRQRDTLPPSHFAYGNASALDEPPDERSGRRYLLVTRLGRIKNPRFYPEYRQYWRHNPSDFRELQRDPDVAHVYDDGGFDAYIVRNVGDSGTNESAAARPSPARRVRASGLASVAG